MNPLPFILLGISLPLLLGGCGERPVAVQKAIEGVDWEETEEREGIMYLKGSDTPYTGKAFELYGNGKKAGEANWKDGKRNGLTLEWYDNGQKLKEINFKDGKVDGLEVWWHKNGQKQIERHFKDDIKVENSEKFWNSKGEPVDSIIRSSF